MTEPTDNKQKIMWQTVEKRVDEIANDANDASKNFDEILSGLKNLIKYMGIGCIGLSHQPDRAEIWRNIDKIRDWIRDTRNDQRLDRAAELAEKADKLADRADKRADRMVITMYGAVAAAIISAACALVTILLYSPSN